MQIAKRNLQFHIPWSHILRFLKKNAVLCVAILAAVLTSFIVPPDKAYFDYFDWKTLTCLFCVLAVVCAFKNISFFTVLAEKIVGLFKNARACVLALAYVTFLGSMLIANDMALLTFLPLGMFVLTTTGKNKYMAFTFIMQNIAANLGGMLTPFGNPQNLYLYSHFGIPDGEFILIMLPPFLLASSLILAQAQRLFRRLCPVCRKPVDVNIPLLEANGVDPAPFEGVQIYGPGGCPKCHGSGYKGRGAFMEVLPISPKIRGA